MWRQNQQGGEKPEISQAMFESLYLHKMNQKICAKEQDLICPVCMESASAPILMCEDQHLICLTTAGKFPTILMYPWSVIAIIHTFQAKTDELSSMQIGLYQGEKKTQVLFKKKEKKVCSLKCVILCVFRFAEKMAEELLELKEERDPAVF